MKWVVRVIQGLLIIGFLMSGITKLSGNAQMTHDFTEVYGYTKSFMYFIGTVEILGALGLLIGFWKSKVAILASSGLAIIMAGGIYTHLDAGQGFKVALAPFVLLVLALIVVFFRRGNSK